MLWISFLFSIFIMLQYHAFGQKNISVPVKAFFRKSPYCTFYCINPGFGRPWGMLWIFFFTAIFILLQKNAFGQKKRFKFHARGQKCHFGKIAKSRFIRHLSVSPVPNLGKTTQSSQNDLTPWILTLM